MPEVIIHNHQNLLDIAIQETGGIDSVFEIAMDNGVGVSDEITPGTKLKIKQKPVNAVVLEYYKKNNLLPATGGVAINEDECNGLLTEDGDGLLTEDDETIIY